LITATSIIGVLASAAFQQVALAVVPLSAAVLVNRAKRQETAAQHQQVLIALQRANSKLQGHVEQLCTRTESLEAAYELSGELSTDLAADPLTRQRLRPLINQIQKQQLQLRRLEFEVSRQERLNGYLQEQLLATRTEVQAELHVQSQLLANAELTMTPYADPRQSFILVDTAAVD
jgi:hypothetical protein